MGMDMVAGSNPFSAAACPWRSFSPLFPLGRQ
jgi:hypothetical protein